MTDKIRSVLTEDGDQAEKLQAKYEEIYKDANVWLYEKSQGVHSVITAALKEELAGKRCLDLGCGAGRLPIMCAHFAKEAWGLDFSKKAIEIAKLCAKSANKSNTHFVVNKIDPFCAETEEPFDVITTVGVLEHVPDPLVTMKNMASILKPGGLLVVSCPNFVNFRGATYMTLLTLLDLPMSLADLRQIDVEHIRKWTKESGLALENTMGAIYNFAFGEKAAKDMTKRVPLAVRDKGLAAGINYDAYQTWLERMTIFNDDYLKWLQNHDVLKAIERPVHIEMHQPEDVPDELAGNIKQYLTEDFTTDPYYSDVAPFCYFGGEGIYFLRKKG